MSLHHSNYSLLGYKAHCGGNQSLRQPIDDLFEDLADDSCSTRSSVISTPIIVLIAITPRYLHSFGTVHLDLKADNCFVDGEMRVPTRIRRNLEL